MSNNHMIRIRVIINAFMVAMLLAGLIPPPLINNVTERRVTALIDQTLPDRVAEPITEAATALLSRPSTVYATPGDNIALSGTASQIDTDFDGVASRGNDGNTDGNYSNNSVTHTRSTNEPWWQVDLGSSQFIGSVVVWNRTDGGQSNIDNSYILVSDTPFTANDAATARMQAKFEFHLTSANRPNPSTSATVNDFGRYVRVHAADNTGHLHLAEVQVIEGTPPYGPGDIVGTVYNDQNYNGTLNGEPGIEGVLVTAVTNAGTFTDTTDVNGDYAFSGLTGNARLEFTLPADGSLNYFEPTVAGDTQVQFVDATNGVQANAGFQEPTNYAQANPPVVTIYQVGGNQDAAGNTMRSLVQFPYTSSGISPQTRHVNTSGTTELATNTQIGTTWGLAYARSNRKIYTAAFLKRHSGLVSGQGNELGNIWVTDLNSGNATSHFVNVAPTISVGSIGSNASRGINGGNEDPSVDGAAFAQIGKMGLGDLDISADEQTLYVVSLNSKELVSIDIATQAISAVTIPDPGCVGGQWRPFGLEVYRGDIYVGGVCDSSATVPAAQSSPNLDAYVYRYDGSTFNNILKVDLDYAKGHLFTNSSPAPYYSWQDSWPTDHNAWQPQPILSDIEFDDNGNMLLAFMDRYGHQAGANNFDPSGNPMVQWEVVAGGDLLIACPNAGGTFVVESNGSCGGVTGVNAGNSEGIGGGEFYDDNFYKNGGPGHRETSNGALALLPGAGELVHNTMNPVDWPGSGTDQDWFRAGGPVWHSTSNGAALRGFHVFRDRSAPSGVAVVGKSHGMGDIELLLDPAPIEVGNRVWEDTDSDGVQDPDEAGINGVLVTLHDMDNGGAQVGAAQTTSGNGDFLFTNLDVNTNYQVRVSLSDTEITNRSLFITTSNADGQGADNNNKTDLHDSDGDNGGLNAGFSTIAFATGGPGQNNHTLDFGFSSTQLPPTGNIEVTKNIAAGSDPSGVSNWEFTIASTTAGCVLPSPYDTTPAQTTATGADGQTVTFSNLPVDDGSSNTCTYTITETNMPAGWQTTSSTTNPQTGLMVLDGLTTQISFTNEEIPVVIPATLQIIKQVSGGSVTDSLQCGDHGTEQLQQHGGGHARHAHGNRRSGCWHLYRSGRVTHLHQRTRGHGLVCPWLRAEWWHNLHWQRRNRHHYSDKLSGCSTNCTNWHPHRDQDSGLERQHARRWAAVRL